MRVVPFGDLTPEQQAFATLPMTRHAAAVGMPGSGKTLVLVHRAQRLVAGGVDPARIKVVTYTNALESYIRSGLAELGLPSDMVISFDALMRDLHVALTGKSFRAPAEEARGKADAKGAKRRRKYDDAHFNGQRDAVNELLKNEHEYAMFPMEHRWEAVLVDETQDLSPVDVETLTMLGRHVTVVLDGRQQLYTRGGEVDEILAALGLRWQTTSLLHNFRCTQSVLHVAACAAEASTDRANLPESIGRIGVEERSRRVVARDRDEEDEYLHDAINARTAKGASCAVLLPTKFYAHGIAKALREEGFSVEGPDSVDLSSDAIKVLTYHAAKGLTFDSVFLPRLWESQLRDVARHTRRGSLLFVALTRATSYLFLAATAGQQAKEWASFDAVEEKYLETVVPSAARQEQGSEQVTVAAVDEEAALDGYM